MKTKSILILATLAALLLPPMHAAQQTINVGTTANDGTGDSIRASFQKTNANFTELYGYGASPSAWINPSNWRSALELGSSLPTASQIEALAGSANDKAMTPLRTTQAALTNTNGVWIMPSFRYEDLSLQISVSVDGKKWTAFSGELYKPADGDALRDPSLYYQSSTGTWFIAHTCSNGGSYLTDHFAILKSTDLSNWTLVTNVTLAGATSVWSPDWFTDPATGNVGIVISYSTSVGGGISGTSKICYLTPSASDMSAWNAPTDIFTSQNAIDPFLIYYGGTYYLWYKNETTKYIEVASSSTLTGTYTRIKSGDWAGWGSGFEGVSVEFLPNGNVRVYAEHYQSAPYVYQYAESSSLLSGWSAMSSITYNMLSVQTSGAIKHGTPLLLRQGDQMMATLIAISTANGSRTASVNNGLGARPKAVELFKNLILSGDGTGGVYFNLLDRAGSGSYNGISVVAQNDTLRLFRTDTPSGGNYLADINLATLLLDWYGPLKARGALTVTDVTESSSTASGSGIFGGGIGVAGNGYFGGAVVSSYASNSVKNSLEADNSTPALGLRNSSAGTDNKLWNIEGGTAGELKFQTVNDARNAASVFFKLIRSANVAQYVAQYVDIVISTAGKGIRWGSSSGPIDTYGTGSPEGVVTAPISSTYRRTDGGAATSFYVKESGAGNTGWVGK